MNKVVALLTPGDTETHQDWELFAGPLHPKEMLGQKHRQVDVAICFAPFGKISELYLHHKIKQRFRAFQIANKFKIRIHLFIYARRALGLGK